MTVDLTIDAAREEQTIVDFIRDTFARERIEKAVIGLSGGIDSAVSFMLLARAVSPANIIAVHLPYFESEPPAGVLELIKQVRLPEKQFMTIPVNKPVDAFAGVLENRGDELRHGNLMVRSRMIILYDLAKKYGAMVCGTENRSEHYLGYFTRGGDEISDIEPIRRLFKTQVYQLARHLKVPSSIINEAPTAGMWTGQTDEGQLGFTYREADQVLSLYFDRKLTADKIKKMGFPATKAILKRVRTNEFKHQVPYMIER